MAKQSALWTFLEYTKNKKYNDARSVAKDAQEEYIQIRSRGDTTVIGECLTNVVDGQVKSADNKIDRAIGEYENIYAGDKQKYSPSPSTQQDSQNRRPGARPDDSIYGRHGTQPNNPEQERSKYKRDTPGHDPQSGLTREPTSWKSREDTPPGHKADTGHESKNISYALRRNNPEIADLSDNNRPTKIAERYSELYDNEWTDAYDALTSILKDKDKDRRAIEFLYEVVKKYSPSPSTQQDPQNRRPGVRTDDSNYGRQETQPINPEQERSKYKRDTPGHDPQSGLMREPTSWKSREDTPPGHKADTGHESKNISYALRRNNPEIADLSDNNRPTKIAKRYSELYDNEWIDAFDALTSVMKDKDKDRRAIDFLYEVVKTAYELCCKKADQQITEMRTQFLNVIGSVDSSSQAPKGRGKEATEKDEDDWILLQYRKRKAEVAVEGIVKEFSYREFKTIYSRHFNKMQHKPYKDGPLHLFASRAAQLAWWMAVQDPPVYMDIPDPRTKDAAKFNSSLYRAYTQSGQQVEYYVWPALLLFQERDNKSGPVLVKGVAQGKK